MLLLGTSQKIRLSRRCRGLIRPSSRFLYASGFATQTLAHMLDSLVRVSRRVGTLHKAWSWRCTAQSHTTTPQSKHRMIQAMRDRCETKGRNHLVASLHHTASPGVFTEHKSKASLLTGFLRHDKATRLVHDELIERPWYEQNRHRRNRSISLHP